MTANSATLKSSKTSTRRRVFPFYSVPGHSSRKVCRVVCGPELWESFPPMQHLTSYSGNMIVADGWQYGRHGEAAVFVVLVRLGGLVSLYK